MLCIFCLNKENSYEPQKKNQYCWAYPKSSDLNMSLNGETEGRKTCGKVGTVVCVRKSEGLVWLKGRFGMRWVYPQLGLPVNRSSFNVGFGFCRRSGLRVSHTALVLLAPNVDPAQQSRGPPGSSTVPWRASVITWDSLFRALLVTFLPYLMRCACLCKKLWQMQSPPPFSICRDFRRPQHWVGARCRLASWATSQLTCPGIWFSLSEGSGEVGDAEKMSLNQKSRRLLSVGSAGSRARNSWFLGVSFCHCVLLCFGLVHGLAGCCVSPGKERGDWQKRKCLCKVVRDSSVTTSQCPAWPGQQPVFHKCRRQRHSGKGAGTEVTFPVAALGLPAPLSSCTPLCVITWFPSCPPLCLTSFWQLALGVSFWVSWVGVWPGTLTPSYFPCFSFEF